MRIISKLVKPSLMLGILVASATASADVLRIESAAFCKDMFTPPRKIETPSATYVFKSTNVTVHEIQALDAVIADVNGFLGRLARPEKPVIKMARIHSSPAAQEFFGTINMGVRYGFPRGEDKTQWDTKHPEYVNAIMAHEYAHLVFGSNMSKVEPLWKEYAESPKKQKEIGAKISAMLEESLALREKLKTADDTVKAQVEAQIAENQSKLNTLFDESSRLSRDFGELISIIHDASTSYNEFFADVIAILQTERPDSIYRSVRFVRLQQQAKNEKEEKDMKDGKDRRHFDKHLTDVPEGYEEHGYLAPVRKFVWDAYLASPTILKAKKAEIAEGVFKAVSEELEYVFNHYDMDFKQNWQTLNDRLIARIKAEMEKRGISTLK